MIHHMKDGITLSHWIQIGYHDFVKHRLNGDYADRIMLMKMGPYTYQGPSVYYFSVKGERLKYIETAYIATYGSSPIIEENLQQAKDQIDIFLNKIDNLLVFI